MKEITSKKFNQLKDAVVEFNAPWCGACRVQRSILDSAVDINIPIYSYNVEQESSLAPILGISSLPTTLVLKAGKERARHVGIIQPEQLKELIK